jgi:hypothetical protein
MRPYWKGYLKLALVSCPIALHAACSTAERIALNRFLPAVVFALALWPIKDQIDPEFRCYISPQPWGSRPWNGAYLSTK